MITTTSLPVPSNAHQVLNVLLMQAAWFIAVLSAARGNNWPGCVAVAAVLLWHLQVVERPVMELKLIGWVTALGVLVECLNTQLGWLQAQATLRAQLPAPWLIALWSLFAVSLNVSLRWLKQHRLGAALLGALAGPLAYAGGARLDALRLINPLAAMVSLSIFWAIAMPLMLWLAERLDGVSSHER